MTETSLYGLDDDSALVDLVARAATGDQQAWRDIVSRYAQLVWSVACSHRLERDEADDVSQVTWLRLAEHLHTLREAAKLSDWLATTARRESLGVLARRSGRIERLTTRMTGWSVAVLPVEERERYRDEFAAELFELRAAPWRVRTAYALRLLVRSVGLRRALREPRPVVPARVWDR